MEWADSEKSALGSAAVDGAVFVSQDMYAHVHNATGSYVGATIVVQAIGANWYAMFDCRLTKRSSRLQLRIRTGGRLLPPRPRLPGRVELGVVRGCALLCTWVGFSGPPSCRGPARRRPT